MLALLSRTAASHGSTGGTIVAHHAFHRHLFTGLYLPNILSNFNEDMTSPKGWYPQPCARHTRQHLQPPPPPPPLPDIEEELQGTYRRWWLNQTHPTNSPKLSTFHPAPYLNTGLHYLSPQALRFRCSNHRLDIELGRHTNTARPDRTCRYCTSGSLGDEYHAFQCSHFLDLQVYCGIHITSRPNFTTLMQDFPHNVQRYVSLVMIRLQHQ